MKKLVVLCLLFTIIFIQSKAFSRLVNSPMGFSEATRAPIEPVIVFHTQIDDSTLINALRCPYRYTQRLAVETLFKQVGEGKKLTPEVVTALKSYIQGEGVIYPTTVPLRIILIVSQDTDKESRAKQLAECFNGDYLLKKKSLYYAGRLGYDSLLSQISTKLNDRDMGNPCLSEELPYEEVRYYAELAIELIKMNHLPKEKQPRFLLNQSFQKERTIAREEAMVDMGEEIIPLVIDRLTTSFISGKYKDRHFQCLAHFVLRNMEIPDAQVTKALIPFLDSENPDIRDLAITSLEGIGTPEAILYLEKANPQDKFLKSELPDIIQRIKDRDLRIKKIMNK